MYVEFQIQYHTFDCDRSRESLKSWANFGSYKPISQVYGVGTPFLVLLFTHDIFKLKACSMYCKISLSQHTNKAFWVTWEEVFCGN